VTEILAELFSSKVRAAVLEQMLPRPQHGYSLTELSRILDLPISSLQHECYKLERIGIVRARREGNSRRYRVDRTCPVLPQLTALVVAAMGPAQALAATLEGIPGLQTAFLASALPLSASVAATSEPIPLVLIGEISLEAIDAAKERVAELLSLPADRIEAVFYRPSDWQSRLDQRSPYAVGLLDGPRTDLVGSVAEGAPA
jgi:DNA-binding transcriptional ArsR family regulator